MTGYKASLKNHKTMPPVLYVFDSRLVVRQATAVLWVILVGLVIFLYCTQKDYSDLVGMSGCVESATLTRIGKTKSLSMDLRFHEKLHEYGVRLVGQNKPQILSIKSGDCVSFLVTKSTAENANTPGTRKFFAIGLELNGERVQTVEEALDGMQISIAAVLKLVLSTSAVSALVVFLVRPKDKTPYFFARAKRIGPATTTLR